MNKETTGNILSWEENNDLSLPTNSAKLMKQKIVNWATCPIHSFWDLQEEIEFIEETTGLCPVGESPMLKLVSA